MPTVGFLTVQSFADVGLIGGYLLLNPLGRPLEFHCTAPVRPNRAQEILYGPTLAPYLYGEQIAQTLLEKGKSRPQFVCTDTEPVLSARHFVALPLVLLEQAPQRGHDVDASAARGDLRLDTAHATRPAPKTRRLIRFELEGCPAAVEERYQRDRDDILESWQAQACELDLWEPFGRLHEAIEEAQRGAART